MQRHCLHQDYPGSFGSFAFSSELSLIFKKCRSACFPLGTTNKKKSARTLKYIIFILDLSGNAIQSVFIYFFFVRNPPKSPYLSEDKNILVHYH